MISGRASATNRGVSCSNALQVRMVVYIKSQTVNELRCNGSSLISFCEFVTVVTD